MSRTLTVRQTCLPSTGYSMRLVAPGASDEVYWTESLAGLTFRTVGAPMVTLRPVGTLYRSNRT